MPRDLEELMANLRDRRPDRSLSGLEAAVWAHIAARRGEVSPATLWGWRSATAALLLAVGLIVGGTTSGRAPAEAGIFTTRAALAPSTLLGEAP